MKNYLSPALFIKALVPCLAFSLRVMPSTDPEEGGYSVGVLILYAGMGLMFLWKMLSAPLGKFRLMPLSGYILAFLLLYVLAFIKIMAFDDYVAHPQTKMLNVIAALALSVMTFVVYSTRKDLYALIAGIVSAGVITAIVNIASYSSVHYIPELRVSGIQGTHGSANTMACVLAASLCMGPMAWIIVRRGYLAFNLSLAVCVGASLCLFFSLLLVGTRGAAIAVVVVGAVLVWLAGGRRWRLVPLGIILFIFIIYIVVPEYKQSQNEGIGRIVDIFNLASERNFVTELSESGRWLFWSQTVEMLMSSPGSFVFGNGLGQFNLYLRGETYVYQHNVFVEAAGDAGVFAGIVLVLLLCRCILMLIQQYRMTSAVMLQDKFILLSLIAFGIVTAIVGTSTFSVHNHSLMWVFVGSAAGCLRLTLAPETSPCRTYSHSIWTRFRGPVNG